MFWAFFSNKIMKHLSEDPDAGGHPAYLTYKQSTS